MAHPGPTHVVDPHHEDDRVGVRVGEDVAIETRQRVDPHAVGQHFAPEMPSLRIATGRRPLWQTARRENRQPIVAVDRRAIAVRDRVAERDDSAGVGGSVDHDLGQKHPLRLFGVGLEIDVGDLVARSDISGLVTVPMHRRRRRDFREEQADRDFRERRDREVDRVADRRAPTGMTMEGLPPKVTA